MTLAMKGPLHTGDPVSLATHRVLFTSATVPPRSNCLFCSAHDARSAPLARAHATVLSGVNDAARRLPRYQAEPPSGTKAIWKLMAGQIRPVSRKMSMSCVGTVNLSPMEKREARWVEPRPWIDVITQPSPRR
jgi:hypothetical protein